MNYNTALKLKEAGFPMKNLKDWNMVECPFPWGHFKGEDGESYIFPTLEELIESCGDGFLNLHIQSKEWVSFGDNGTEELIEGRGSIPSEAVANLWLALNEK